MDYFSNDDMITNPSNDDFEMMGDYDDGTSDLLGDDDDDDVDGSLFDGDDPYED